MTGKETPAVPGAIDIHLISHSKLSRMGTAEKLRYILDEVVAGKILVLEHGLSHTEEAQLIEATMRAIEPDRFSGIEMQSYGPDPVRGLARLAFQRRRGRPRMAVIGPAHMLRTVSKDSQSIHAMIVASHGLLKAEA